MDGILDYYAFLGVPRNAPTEDIKRAYIRKNREFNNDMEKGIQLNQVYAVLCDKSARKQYDLSLQFGNQTEDIKEKIINSQNLEERNSHLFEARELYLDILQSDSENADALWNLVGIEELLGNEDKAIEYLKILNKYVKDDEEKLKIYHRLGVICKNQGRTDDAIKCLYQIYKADDTKVNDIKALVRLFYEDKENVKTAIQILNDCINRSKETNIKIQYLCETLRAIRVMKNASYQKLEDVVYKKLEAFCTDNKEENLVNAAIFLTCFEDTMEREDFECFHRLERIFEKYNVENEELKKAFLGLQQIATAMESGKIHQVIDLYLKAEWNKEIRKKVIIYVITDAEAIKESLDYLKKEAPVYWELEEKLLDLEKLVNDNLIISKEFLSLSHDRSVSSYIKTMMECIILNGYISFDDMREDFEKARDSFFEKEDKEKLRHTLEKMEEFYPECYKLFADIFFDGKTTDELFIGEKNVTPTPASSSGDDSNNNSKDVWIGITAIIAIVIACISYPPLIFAIYIIFKLIGRNEDKKDLGPEELERKAEHERQEKIKAKERRKKLFKWIKIIIAVILIWAIVSNVYQYVKEKREEVYQDSHDNWLTEEELENIAKLQNRYDKKTDVAIRYLQGYSFEASEYDYDDRYVYLVLLSGGQCSIYSNVLDESEIEEFASEVWAIFDEDLEDYAKCARFFEIALTYIKLADVSSDVEMNQEMNEESNETTYESIYEEFNETNYEEADLIESYINYINKNIDTSSYGLSGYNMVYINNDDIPELVLLGSSEADGNVICTYIDGEFYYINLWRSYFYFIPKKNVINNSEGNMGYYYDYIYNITNNGFSPILRGEWESNFDESENVVDNFRIDGSDVSIEDYAQAVDRYYGDSSTISSYALKNYSSVQEAYDGLMNDQNIDYSNNTYSNSWEEDSEDLLLQ